MMIMMELDDYLSNHSNQTNYLGSVVIAAPSIEATSTTSFDETCQSELDHFPTAIQKLTFSSCIGDSSMLTWPNETVDNELDEINKSIESNIECLRQDADSLIDSLQEALFTSQERNYYLQQAMEQMKQELYHTQNELLKHQQQQEQRPPSRHTIEDDPIDTQEGQSQYDSTFSLPEISPKCTVIRTSTHDALDPNNDNNDDTEEAARQRQEEIDQLQNEISIQNQYISTLSEKSVYQAEELQLAHERIRILEYQILQQEEKLREDDTAISFQKELIEKQQDYITRLKRKKMKSNKNDNKNQGESKD
jgi:peptidoglycan hydrolase CwlO-like protein